MSLEGFIDKKVFLIGVFAQTQKLEALKSTPVALSAVFGQELQTIFDFNVDFNNDFLYGTNFPAYMFGSYLNTIVKLRGVYGVTAVGQNNSLYQGDSQTIIYTIYNQDGSTPSFSSPTCIFVITADYLNGPDLLTITGLVPVLSSGVWSVTINLTTTQTLSLPIGVWKSQIRLTDTGGVESTLAVGKFQVFPIRAG